MIKHAPAVHAIAIVTHVCNTLIFPQIFLLGLYNGIMVMTGPQIFLLGLEHPSKMTTVIVGMVMEHLIKLMTVKGYLIKMAVVLMRTQF